MKPAAVFLFVDFDKNNYISIYDNLTDKQFIKAIDETGVEIYRRNFPSPY